MLMLHIALAGLRNMPRNMPQAQIQAGHILVVIAPTLPLKPCMAAEAGR